MSQFSVALPWPYAALTPNAREHHFTVARSKKAYRTNCGWEAKAAGLRKLPPAKLSYQLTFMPPDRKSRDIDNAIASMKSGLDGVADVIGIDDKHWTMEQPLWGQPTKGGKVLVRFTILTADVPLRGPIS